MERRQDKQPDALCRRVGRTTDEPQDPSILANRLARLYPDAFETLQVLRKVGLDVNGIPADARPRALLNIWKAAVAAADGAGLLPALLQTARAEYGRKRVTPYLEPTNRIRTVIAPMMIGGVALGIAVALTGFVVRMDTSRWVRMDEIHFDFSAELAALEAERAAVPPATASPTSVVAAGPQEPGPPAAKPALSGVPPFALGVVPSPLVLEPPPARPPSPKGATVVSGTI